MLGHHCPCFSSHCRAFHLLCSSQLSWVLIIYGGDLNEVPAWLDSICPVFLLGREELSVSKTLPIRDRLIPHLQRTLMLPEAVWLLLSFSLYLAQISHVKKQTQMFYLRLDKAYMGNSVNYQGELPKQEVFAWYLNFREGCLNFKSRIMWRTLECQIALKLEKFTFFVGVIQNVIA